MNKPLEWFKKAIDSGEYEIDVITEMESCISEDGFDVNEFMDWTDKKINQELSDD
ncbi:hypothetical protein C7960_1795 [Methanohalophilus euhalobius]|jgi:hypothetical protein|uniref:Uncharacterized protein n=1 Tax=Methanohalophilus euhalobius TaxID=51203 RepID=A0A285FZK2_9EURY|nr:MULTISPECIES: hypothetical protein [Methanohalophilus]ODV49077.1 MAG: hypothetical protein A8273_1601 [Methanohalophilus sp. 2-GBenrich]TCL12532.1 hypothetical protein C7960_1795 [Methanohalophilus euhalobius]SNY16707.1 hypothetical protein SAMN06295989_10634 [Methanohalophilus euhalobius]